MAQQQQSPTLASLGLPPDMLQLLTSKNLISSRDVLVLSVLDLMELLNLNYKQAEEVLHEVAALTAPPYCTALQLHTMMHQHSVKLLTGLEGLDAALRVGVPAGAIMELVGPAGVGKSQFCYSLALQVAMPPAFGGLGACVLFIDTEGKLSTERLSEMAAARFANPQQEQQQQQQQFLLEAGSLDAAVGAALQRIIILKPQSAEQLQQQLQWLKTEVPNRDIKAILLDSVAALLRADLHNPNDSFMAALAARGELLGRQAAALKMLAEANRIPVVVTNQVTARAAGPDSHTFQQQQYKQQQQQQQQYHHHQPQQQQQHGQLSAALGTKWAHAVNVRLVLERQGSRRFVKIAKSPLSANAVFEYTINAPGVQQVLGTDLPQVVQQNVLEMQIANEFVLWE